MNIADIIFSIALTESESARINIVKKFRAFYDNDYDEIVDYLKEDVLNKPFGQDTLDKLRFQHLDIIKKAISRSSAGIYDIDPIRTLIKPDGKLDDNLPRILKQVDYAQKVKEAFRRGIFFNLCLAHPIQRDDITEIDLLTPDEFIITAKNNYLKIKEIAVARSDGKNIYSIVWNENEHYKLDTNNTKIPVDGNPNMINPYGIIPFAILRVKEGMDFYGEPNWNLLLNQIAVDIKLTDLDYTEIQQNFGVWFGVNTDLGSGQKFDPGTLIQINGATNERGEYPPSLQNIVPQISWEAHNSNIDWRIKTTLLAEGLSGSSVSMDTKILSGSAKSLDEIELQEKRENYKSILIKFELELLNIFRTVWNYNNPDDKLSNGEFEVSFSKEKPHETIDEKAKRRIMEKKFYIGDEIDFIMEDKGLDEMKAIEYLQKRKERKKVLELEDSSPLKNFNQNKTLVDMPDNGAINKIMETEELEIIKE